MTVTNVSTLALFIFAFFCGSLMFSAWIARLRGKDLRAVGDGNPGMTNVMISSGIGWGALAFALDVIKGAIPVAIAFYGLGVRGWDIVAIAIAPILGHAFSPFLRFRGGKAMAVTMGVWMALTLWEIPTLGGFTLGLWYVIVRKSGWAVLMLFICILVYTLITPHEWFIPVIVLLNMIVVLYKYRADFRHPPGLRGWILRRLPSSSGAVSDARE